MSQRHLIAVAIALALPTALSAQPFYQLDVISQTGDPVPGGNGAFVGIPGTPRNSQGIVMYYGKGSNGEEGFYAGIAGGGVDPCWVVVDNTMPVPGGQGNYTGFGAASWDNGNAAFHAFGSGGQDGVYVAADVIPCWLVADTNSPIPDGQGNYTGFDAVAIEGDVVAFRAFGAGGQDGVYGADDVTPCWLVADLATPIPGGQHGNFTAFSLRPFIDQGDIAFAGFGEDGYTGLFMYDGKTLVTLDDTDRPVPGGNGTYTQFLTAAFAKSAIAFHGQGTSGEDGIFIAEGIVPCWSVAMTGDPMPGGAVLQGIEGVAFDGTHVAFVGLGSKAIYSDLGGVMRLVIAVGDVLDNRVIDDLAIGPEGLSASRIAFWAHFTDKTEAVYLATYLPDVSGVGDTPPASAMAFTNYPNPFADRTDFEFVLPGAGRVRLEVYDVAGRLVASRDLGVRESGENRATFEGRGLATGVYFCRLQSGAYAATRKMLIER